MYIHSPLSQTNSIYRAQVASQAHFIIRDGEMIMLSSGLFVCVCVSMSMSACVYLCVCLCVFVTMFVRTI